MYYDGDWTLTRRELGECSLVLGPWPFVPLSFVPFLLSSMFFFASVPPDGSSGKVAPHWNSLWICRCLKPLRPSRTSLDFVFAHCNPRAVVRQSAARALRRGGEPCQATSWGQPVEHCCGGIDGLGWPALDSDGEFLEAVGSVGSGQFDMWLCVVVVRGCAPPHLTPPRSNVRKHYTIASTRRPSPPPPSHDPKNCKENTGIGVESTSWPAGVYCTTSSTESRMTKEKSRFLAC